MKRTLTMIAGLACIANVLAKDTTSELKSYLRTMKPALEKAFAKKDLKYFDVNMTSDFVYTSGKVTDNKKQCLAAMKQLFAMGSSMNASVRLISAKATDGNGVAVIQQKLSSVMVSPQEKGQKHTMVSDSQIRMTMVKQGKTWIMKKLEDVVPPKMTIDGKPYDPYAGQDKSVQKK